jgi:hypothetical protein
MAENEEKTAPSHFIVMSCEGIPGLTKRCNRADDDEYHVTGDTNIIIYRALSALGSWHVAPASLHSIRKVVVIVEQRESYLRTTYQGVPAQSPIVIDETR